MVLKRADRKPISILHIITRMEEGGAPVVVLSLLGGLGSPEFSQYLVTGPVHEGRDLSTDAERMGVFVARINTLTREIRPIKDLMSLFSLVSLIRKGNYDIVHTHTSKAGFLGRFAARLAGNRHVIYSPHGNIFSGYFSGLETWVYTFAERLSAHWCARIVTLSEAGVEEFLKRKIGERGQYRVIYNGIDIEAFKSGADREGARRELGLYDDDFVIASVGRLVPVKGHRFLVSAGPGIIEGLENGKGGKSLQTG